MRPSLPLLGCSVATIAAIACSGTTFTQSGLSDTTGGSAGAAQTTVGGRSVATGIGGQSVVRPGASSTVSGSHSTGGSLAEGGAATGGATTGGASNLTVSNGGQSGLGGTSANSASSLSVPAGGFGAGGSSTLGSTATGGVAPTGGTTAAGGTSATVVPPSITSVSPASGVVTTTVAIAGKNFGATQGASTVKIAGNAVTPSFWSDTSIEIAIPRAVLPGTTSIVVTIGDAQPIASTFEVTLPRTIYVNRGAQPANAVAAFSLTTVGVMKELTGSPYATGDTSATSGAYDCASLAFNRATRRLFAISDSKLTVFDIDPVSGQLTAAGPAVSTGAAGASGIVVNAAGTLVYVTNFYREVGSYSPSPSISAFTVSPLGALTAVSGSPYRQGGYVFGSPALLHGDSLLVVNSENDTGPDFNALFVNRVNPTTGVLTPAAELTTGLKSRSGAADPSGTWYYQADTFGSARLAGFSLLRSEADMGTPVPLAGTPIAMNTTSINANGLAFTPNSAYLYVGLYDDNQLSGFSLNAGIPTLLPGSPFTMDGPSVITTLAVTRSGSQLVIADGVNSTLSVHTIGASGIPTTSGNGGSFASVGAATGLVIAE